MAGRTPVSPATSPQQNAASAAAGNNTAPTSSVATPSSVPVAGGSPVATPRTGAEQDAAPTTGASPTSSNESNAYTTDIGSMMAMKDRIAEQAPWSPNSLNDYLNYTYHFRLFMTQDEDFLTTLNAGDRQGELSSSDVFSAIDENPMRVIAESGVTAGFAIQEVKIESLVGPNKETLNTNATNFVIQITEPLGTSLVETMRNAAVDLKIRNMDKAPYFLELTFVGYDESGNIVGQVEDQTTQTKSERLLSQDFDNGGRWIYQIKISDIETELTSSGSTYTLTALPYSEFAFDHTMGCLPAGLNISGNTVQEFLDNFATELNKSWQKYYLNDPANPVYDFKFKVQTVGETNAGDFKLTPPDDTVEETRNYVWDQSASIPTMHANIGMEVSAVIETVLASTRETQERALSVLIEAESHMSEDDAKTAQENRSDMAAVALYRAAQMFRVEPDIEVIGYYYTNNVYRKKCTMHVWPFYTQAPVLSKSLASAARDPAYQSRLFNELIDRGFFRKKYDYIFTGNNTEITRLDIRFNLAWAAVLPMLENYVTSSETTAVHARRPDDPAPETTTATPGRTDGDVPRLPPNASLEQRQAAVAEATRERAANESATADLTIRRNNATRAGNTAEAERLQAEIDRLNVSQIDANRRVASIAGDEQNQNAVGILARRQNEQDAAISASRSRGADKVYLEDLDQPIASESDTDALPHTISFTRPFNQLSNNVGAGYASPNSGERGVYGAILEQMYGPLTTGLINIDLEIRGDPYWLSYSNVERRIHLLNEAPPLTPAARMANYAQGDNVFMLEFSYPFDIDSETGDPNIRETVDTTARFGVDRIDKFTGIYRVVRATHTFSGGDFRQTLKAQRYALHDLARAMRFEGVNGMHAEGTYTGAQRTAPANAPRSNGQAAAQRPNTGSGGAPAPTNQSGMLGSLDPRMQRVFTRAQQIEAAKGNNVRIAGLGARRTEEQQRQIVGRGKSGILNSRHLTGSAIDIVVTDTNGRMLPGGDQGSHPGYASFSQSMAQASRELNTPILWGGNFSNAALAARERSHYELRRR